MNDLPTIAEKCFGIWRAVCEGRTVDFTWAELEALQEAGFITDLKRVHPYVGKKRGGEVRWTFEWTARLRDLANALGKHTVRHPNDHSPVCIHGIAEGHCPECVGPAPDMAKVEENERAQAMRKPGPTDGTY